MGKILVGNFKGKQGERGAAGKDGINGIDGKDGEQGIQGIKGDKGDQGEKGDRGEPGTDGYTPVRGTDYWTATDVENIKADVGTIVNDAITAALGGNY